MVIIIRLIIIFLTSLTYAEQSVVPLHYDITVIPNWSNLSFYGKTVLKVEVARSIENVTLNSKYLEFTLIKIVDLLGNEVAQTYDFDLNSETLVLHFANQLNEGIYDITFEYTGKINENHEGLYISHYYLTDNGTEITRPFLLTNFQFSYARQVFPCFDHPKFLATYSINIIRSKDYICISNMAKKSEEELPGEDKSVDKFAQSDVMPTYLVSFAIIDFKKIPNVTLSVYTTLQEGTELLMEMIPRVSKKIQELYSFKLTKVDYIIVPDYALPVNSLESIGLIVFRQSTVLLNVEEASVKHKQHLLKSIAHAVAKQTYSNIFTPDWWQYFWLNEGILGLYQYEIACALEPEWQLLEQFTVNDFHNALENDIHGNELAVAIDENYVPQNLSKDFFSKSFSLTKMLTNLPLPGLIFDNPFVISWAGFKGYPIISANRKNDSRKLTISQDSSTIVPIPFSIITEESQNIDSLSTFVLDEVKQDFDAALKDANSWYIVNKRETGYFRINYEEYWLLITNFLKTPNFNIISPTIRAQIIDDLYNLAHRNITSYSSYLDTIAYVRNEEDFIPLYTFFTTTSRIKTLLGSIVFTGYETVQDKFTRYVRQLVSHLYDKVGSEVSLLDSHIKRLNRMNVLTWLCNFGDERCQSEMHEILARKEKVHPDIKESVYCGGMRKGNVDDFQYLLEQYHQSGDVNVLKYMTCTSNNEILRYYLEGIINQTIIVHIYPQHALDAFLAIIDGSDEGVNLTLDFIKQHLNLVLARFNYNEISKLFINLSKKLVSSTQRAKIRLIVSCLMEPDRIKYFTLFEQVDRNILNNINWVNTHKRSIENWFNDRETTTTTTTITSTATTTTTSGAAAIHIHLCLAIIALSCFAMF